MIRALACRLAYVRYLARPGFWRWVVDKIDYAVTDHIKPWTDLRRPTNCIIHPSVSFRCAENIELGANIRIQPYCVVWASPGSRIRIGENSGLGPQTMIYSSNHQYSADRPYHEQPWTEKDVTIGRDCWIGGGSVILPGVTIGDRSVVAAGSVVTKDVPAGSVVAGAPAKPIRGRAEPEVTPSVRARV